MTPRGASTGATLRSRPRPTTTSFSRVVVPAFHATLLAAALTCLAPIPAGGPAATNDAAVLLGIRPARVLMTPDAARAYIRIRASRNGWRGAQWRCLDAILTAEAHYRIRARNGVHVGIFQHATTPIGATLATQWRLGAKYVAHRYGTPCAALHFRAAHGWY